MTGLDAEQLAEILAEFAVEGREHVDAFEAAMLELERDPQQRGVTAAAFRAIHSIKGNASFLALGSIEDLSHAVETILARLRSGESRGSRALVDALLGAVDLLRRLIDGVAADPEAARREPAELTEVLEGLAPWLEGEAEVELQAEEVEAPRRARGEGRAKIRVDVELLDHMMNLVGELVLARNQVLQGIHEAAALSSTVQRLDSVTTQLQDAVMKTRMQPVGLSWTRLPRVVRDLCHELGKRARVEMRGQETELDKRIIEALHDPLTHLLRNAVDHGVEAPARREELGKPAEACLRLRAAHEGGRVKIEISDDGAGVDLEALRARARRLGLRGGAELEQLDDDALLELLFTPGFSTRDQVTAISGRGVGLDVVRTNIEALGGRIELDSQRAVGTCVRIELPLTLAIIPAVIVSAGGQRFALAQASLAEIVRVDSERGDAGPRLEELRGAPLLRLRGRLLPVIDLATKLELASAKAPRELGEAARIVVLELEELRFGLLVDAVHDTEEIVVKPLWSQLEDIACYAGATILGDGGIALILDAPGLARQAGLSRASERGATRRAVVGDPGPGREQSVARELILLCRAFGGEQLAIRAGEVARLEELSPARVEELGPSRVIQHQGEIVPLVELGSEGGGAATGADPEASLQVVIQRVDGRLAGLVVEGLVDIVEAEVELQATTSRAGMLGSMVLDGRVTQFLDVAGVLRRGLAQRELRA